MLRGVAHSCVISTKCLLNKNKAEARKTQCLLSSGKVSSGASTCSSETQKIVLFHSKFCVKENNYHVCVCVCGLSRVQLFAIPRTVAFLALLSMGFSRQEYWSGLPCPPPGDLPDLGIEAVSLASPALVGGFFTTAPPGKPVK